MKRFLPLILLCALAFPASAQFGPPLATGSALENVDYRFPARFLSLRKSGQDLRMAYLDVRPSDLTIPDYQEKPVEKATTILLLHGKNFGGYYWKNTIQNLGRKGYRIIVPDQIGFGKSSKPDISYSFDWLADNTAKLLDELKVPKVIVVGHSMGGMLAVKFARKFPNRVEKLVLENPIGLEDYGKLTGKVPLETLYKAELGDTETKKIREFFKRYFVTWKPEWEQFVEIKSRVALSGEFPRWAKASAQTYKMILEQPIVGDLPQLKVPTLLIIGQSDRTVVGKNYMTPEKSALAGNYPALGRAAQKAISGSKLVEMANIGHIPHLEAAEAFDSALLSFIEAQP